MDFFVLAYPQSLLLEQKRTVLGTVLDQSNFKSQLGPGALDPNPILAGLILFH